MSNEQPESEEPEMRTGTAYRPVPAPRRNVNERLRANTPPAPRADAEIFEEEAPAKPAYVPPATAEEARVRYWKKWGPHMLDLFFGEAVTMPETIEEWTRLAKATQQIVKARQAASDMIRPSDP